jgi:hypothetical protein
VPTPSTSPQQANGRIKIDPSGLEVSGFTFWQTVAFIGIFVVVVIIFYVVAAKLSGGNDEGIMISAAVGVPIIAIIILIVGMYWVNSRANSELRAAVESRQRGEVEQSAKDEAIQNLYAELKKGAADDQERGRKLDELIKNIKDASAASTPAPTPAASVASGGGEPTVMTRGILIAILVAGFILVLIFELLIFTYLRIRRLDREQLLEELRYKRSL